MPYVWRCSSPDWMGPGQPHPVGGSSAHRRGWYWVGFMWSPLQLKPVCDAILWKALRIKPWLSWSTGKQGSKMFLQIPFSSKAAPVTCNQLRGCRKLPLMASYLTIAYILNVQQQASIYVVEGKKRKINPSSCYFDYPFCMFSKLSKEIKSYLTCLPTLKV